MSEKSQSGVRILRDGTVLLAAGRFWRLVQAYRIKEVTVNNIELNPNGIISRCRLTFIDARGDRTRRISTDVKTGKTPGVPRKITRQLTELRLTATTQFNLRLS